MNLYILLCCLLEYWPKGAFVPIYFPLSQRRQLPFHIHSEGWYFCVLPCGWKIREPDRPVRVEKFVEL